MELLVCVKQVPDDSVNVTLDESGAPKLADITPVANAFDTYALEMATRFKEAHEGNITVLSVGDAEALTPTLRSCLSVGANNAFVLQETGAGDSAGAAHLLAQGSKKVGSFDVIFCGSESTDHASSQVGVRVAAELGIPVVTNVLALEPAEDGLSVKQETEDGYRTVSVPTPCVVTIVKPDYEPRYPSIKSKLAARKMPIGALSAADVEADAAKYGPGAAKARRVKISAPPQRQSGVKIHEKETAESVRRAMEILAEQKLI